MGTELLNQLEALVNSATNEIERQTYRAQWACALARFGQTESARSQIEALRSYNASYEPRLTAWIFLAEGLADHFESLSATAADRFRRAHGLAIALGDAEMRSLAAAWMGASEHLLGRYEEACTRAAEAISHAPATGTLALSRAHLVLADCLYGFGAEVLALKHFAKARHFAIEARGISMQSAILYNLAAYHISRLSFQDAFGESIIEQINTAELELNSVTNLDRGLRVESLPAMIPLLRAQLLLTKKEWAHADELYTSSIAKAAQQGQMRLAARFLAEQAHCRAMLGRRHSSSELAASAVAQLTNRTDIDDRAACHARLSLCYRSLGMGPESDAQAELARKCRAEFVEYQQRLRDKLVSIADG